MSVVLILSALTVRILWIELRHGEGLSVAARSHYEYREELPAQRGRIYDRNGELLARNQTVYTLVVDPYHLRDLGLASIGLAKKEGVSVGTIKKKYLAAEIFGRYREYVVDSLSKPLRIPKHELGKRLREQKGGDLVLARNLEDDFAKEIREILRENSLSGLYLRKGQRRYYPSPLALTQVIGYVGADGHGLEGIEKTFDEEMSGKPGFRYCERDRQRREIHAYRGVSVDPVAGRDVYLTIDMGLQAMVESELNRVMEELMPEKVSTVWVRPATGEILAMANRPHFDLESRKGIRRNIAVADLYQPGSTFKIVGFAGAFDKGLANPNTPINCHMGSYNLEGFPLNDHHEYGVLSAELVLAKSSNIGAYMVSRPLNKHLFHYYMDRFGFGHKTGIQLTAENSGYIHAVKNWSNTSFSSKVIGYEVAVTPLQMAMGFSVIANGGVYRYPTLVKGTKDKKDRRISPIPNSLNEERRVVSEQAANQVRRCLVKAMTEEGTGSKAAFPGYTIAGKTGTARKHVENVGYVDGRYVVSFAGFFPSHQPELLGLVVIDDPKSNDVNLYGGTIAAPVFKNMAQKAAQLLGIAPDKPEEMLAEEVEIVQAEVAGEEPAVDER